MKPVILLTCTITVVLSATTCPPPWKPYNGNCYLFHSGEKTFVEAEQFCKNTSRPDCREASLVSVQDHDEFMFIRDLVYERSLNPLAFFMGGYTTSDCLVGAWTDGSEYPICTGEEHENGVGCVPCQDIANCIIDKCMVANLENWLQSIDGEGNFTAMVSDYQCNETKLPFVCKAKDV